MGLDVRGPRFAATITTLVLIAVLVTGSGWLLLAQAVVFAIGAVNIRRAPYGLLFRALVAPRLRPASEFEPPQPVQFAQAVGLGFALVGAAGYLAGAPVLGAAATAAALVAAFLNAAFAFCLGCEVYLLLKRATTRTTA
jgi:hypothetical protein